MASFSIISNIASTNAQANLQSTSLGLNKALTRLSSGLRINMSGDDAAGLAVANQHRSDIAILNQGIRNANDGLSTLQTKDGALNNISTLLDRLATLATQAASTSNGVDIGKLSDEYGTIIEEMDRQASVAALDTAANFSVFVSSETNAADGVITGSVGAADTTTLVGTLQNRLTFAISLAQSQVVNTKAAESRIRDANIAEESANMTRFNILSQSGIAALAQANQTRAAVLALLR